MQTNLADFIKDTPEGPRRRRDPAQVRALRLLHGHLPHLPASRRRARRPARPHLSHQAGAGRRAADRENAAPPRPLPHLPLVRDHLPFRRALQPPARHRPPRRRPAGRPRGPRSVRAQRRCAPSFPIRPGSGRCSNSGSSCARSCRPRLKRKVPARIAAAGQWPTRIHARKMLVLEGCVQPALSPDTNAAAARVLDRLGITLVRAAGAGCCGGVSFHTSAEDEARDYMRRNVDAWWPHVEAGRGSDRDHRERLRHDGEGLRLPARPRPRLRRQGAAHLRTGKRHQRSHDG